MNGKIRRKIVSGVITAALTLTAIAAASLVKTAELDSLRTGGYIKWVDFGVTAAAMSDALAVDISTYGTENHISWLDILAYLGAKYGGNFSHYRKSDTDKFVKLLGSGESTDSISVKMKYFSYYREAYGAALCGFVGDFYRDGEKLYGLRAFSPIADGYYYQHYDDFGAARSFGYRREHLGHDMMGQIGTPIIAVESGYVEAIGWNRYGGWRIGIRSFDNKRYYYYAHLRKDHPYGDLSEGDIVTAGDVIGYLGMTGYSDKENVNNINIPHLHFGLQLIFDVSQKDGNGEIWIDVYELTKFLYRNRMAVTKCDNGEYRPKSQIVIYDMPD